MVSKVVTWGLRKSWQRAGEAPRKDGRGTEEGHVILWSLVRNGAEKRGRRIRHIFSKFFWWIMKWPQNSNSYSTSGVLPLKMGISQFYHTWLDRFRGLWWKYAHTRVHFKKNKFQLLSLMLQTTRHHCYFPYFPKQHNTFECRNIVIPIPSSLLRKFQRMAPQQTENTADEQNESFA